MGTIDIRSYFQNGNSWSEIQHLVTEESSVANLL